MNHILFIFILLAATKSWSEDSYLDHTKAESIVILSNQIGKERMSELVAVSIETKKFLVSPEKYASIGKAIFVDPKSETQRKPNQNSPLNIEARMAELQARTYEGASPTIFQYKAYVVLSGERTKISEETYDSFFRIRNQP